MDLRVKRTANGQAGLFEEVTPSAGSETCRQRQCHDCGIRALAVCSALSEDELAALAAVHRPQALERHQAIFYEGDDADNVYILTEGLVRTSKSMTDGEQQITGFLMPGELVGVPFCRTYPYTAEALNAVNVCSIERRDFEQLCDRFPRLQRHLLQRLSEKLVQAQEQFVRLARRTVRERLAIFLLSLRQLVHDGGQQGYRLYLPVRRTDIADFLGTSVQPVNRAIRRMEREGIIELPRDDIVILTDEGAVEDLAS